NICDFLYLFNHPGWQFYTCLSVYATDIQGSVFDPPFSRTNKWNNFLEWKGHRKRLVPFFNMNGYMSFFIPKSNIFNSPDFIKIINQWIKILKIFRNSYIGITFIL